MKINKHIFDARIFLFINNLTLVLIGMFFLNLQRTWIQVLSAIASSVTVELIFLWKKNKLHDFRFDKISSCFVTAAGIFLLVYTRSWWPYCVLAAIAITSKHVLRKSTADHIYNPANFAIIFFLAFFPRALISLHADQFILSKYAFWQVLSVGIIMSILVNRWVLILAYVASYVIFSAILGSLSQTMTFNDFLFPEIGTGALIYLFFMITDPRTSPSSWTSQIFWGIFIVLISLWFKSEQIYFGRFLALFFATTAGGLYEVSKSAAGFLKLRQRVET